LSSFDFGQPFEIVKTNNTFSTYKNRQRARFGFLAAICRTLTYRDEQTLKLRNCSSS